MCYSSSNFKDINKSDNIVVTNINIVENKVIVNNINTNVVINNNLKTKRRKEKSDVINLSVKDPRIKLSYYTDDLFFEYLKNIYIQFKDCKKRYKRGDMGCEKKYLNLYLGAIIAYNTGVRINELKWLSYSDIKRLFNIDIVVDKVTNKVKMSSDVICVFMSTKTNEQEQRLLKLSTELLKKIQDNENIKYDYFMSLFDKFYNNVPDKKYNIYFFTNYYTLKVLDTAYFIKMFNKSIRDYIYNNVHFVSQCLNQTQDIDPSKYNFGTHNFFRRTFIHKAEAAGFSIHEISKSVYHKSWQTTALYLSNSKPQKGNYGNFIENINVEK